MKFLLLTETSLFAASFSPTTKIREARLERVPYILVVGEKEAANNEVSVRSRKNDDEGAMALDAFVSRITTEIANKER